MTAEPIHTSITVSDLYAMFGEALGKALSKSGMSYEAVKQILDDAEDNVRALAEERGMESSVDNSAEEPPQADPETELQNGIFNFSVHLIQVLMSKYNVPSQRAREGVSTYLNTIAAGLRQLNQEDSQTTKEETE